MFYEIAKLVEISKIVLQLDTILAHRIYHAFQG